jgi:hypothetical protein
LLISSEATCKLASHFPLRSVRDLVSLLTVTFFSTRADLNQTFSVQPADVIVSTLGDVAVFVCRIGGAPWPRIRWFKNDSEIGNANENADQVGGQGQGPQYVVHAAHGEAMLEISSVQSTDVGRYRCVADNGAEQQRYSRFALLTLDPAAAANPS